MFNRKRIMIGLLVVFLLIAGRLLLPSLGEALIVKDKPAPSDLIVVLMGGGLNRVFGAVDLYNTNYSQRILMVESYQAGYTEAISKGISVPREAVIAKSAAVQLGIPANAITILPGDAKSTKDEALVVRKYLQEHEKIDSIIIATSPTHSARAKKIFNWAFADLDRDVSVLSCPNTYDQFDPAKWWKNRDDVEQVLLEYLKFINFYLNDK
jgi:uncharacterized SAM-binding protein YcdF (DUF218 family)